MIHHVRMQSLVGNVVWIQAWQAIRYLPVMA